MRRGAVYIAEETEARIVERIILRARVFVDARDVRAVRIDENISIADERFDLILPLLRIRCDTLSRGIGEVDVSPAMAADLPAFVAQALRDLAHLGLLLLEFRLGQDAVRNPLRVRAIAESALIACQRNNGACAAIGKVRVLLAELL